MVALDENALICDFAEVYHIFNWRALPARLSATLAMGLRPDARIMLKLGGVQIPVNTQLLAITADAARVIAWQNTEDGRRGRNAPVSVFATLIGTDRKEDGAGFDSPEEFIAWREEMIGGNNG